MGLVTTVKIDRQIEEREHRISTLRHSIELDGEELAMRDEIRLNADEMLAGYQRRAEELEKTLEHELALLKSLDMVQKPFDALKGDVAARRAEATAQERETAERNEADFKAAEAELRAFDEAEDEDAEGLAARREGLEYVLGLCRQALEAAKEALAEAEAAFDQAEKPVLDNIAAVAHNREKHESARLAAEAELEDIAMERAYVNDCMMDETGDDELHDVIRRKERSIADLEQEIEGLRKQRRTYETIQKILIGCLVAFLVLLAIGVARLF